MDNSVDSILHFFTASSRWTVLTGAGLSAASGIPTYRDKQGQWLGSQPILHQEFISSEQRRQRYWGRSMVGWPGVRDARPNSAHLALARWEQSGHIELVITQNVDRLHQRAGSRRVVDLHGRLDRVRCLDCGAGYQRETLQQWLLRHNPDHEGYGSTARPDGDADLTDAQVANIRVPACHACGGMLMPDVVFFGGSIPRQRVIDCEHAIKSSDGLLVAGSSLQVYSGFRFCKLAASMNKPIVILNDGVTRADDLATVKIQQSSMATLVALIDATSGNPQGSHDQPATA